jgi:hypothetical protein
MKPDDLREQLLRLYLRLNGFFTSGFLAHSHDPYKNITEIDTLAVRFPHNSEPERGVEPDQSLDLSDRHIELAICEAKTKPRFNKALYSNISAIEKLLRWAGMFTEDEVLKLAPKVQKLLIPEPNPKPIIRRVSAQHGVVIRALLFCMNYPRPCPNQPWFVGSDSAFRFMFSCLSPAFEPPSCGRRYGAAQWAEFERLIAFFKNWPAQTAPTYKDCAREMT